MDAHAHHMMDHSGMDHGGMDHGGMDHGGHGGGGMDMDRCSMNMLFTWSTKNLCIVFEQWHIRSTAGLIFSLLAVVAIGAGYEALRESIRRYEYHLNKKNEAVPRQSRPKVTREAHFVKAVLYGIQNFYAFMIMLIFMTYNGWVMLAVSFGAFVGYLLFGGSTPATKETACH
ncbi:hypothetical protein MCOR27_003773 [Pyricularia oryzae]|uniref:Copper transport protein n=2 Tax=Pyricularia TaxID=48558 RepID=A0ABQ8NG51_PYRGI|nr:CTR2 short splice, variant [Pyricularia oryzae 70-15]KAI6282371.1 hypothetical protein MCOR27_003773 [Pyricularia oryzae]KAI6295548.1 hypothetical protein MCOR33_007566 [Pyricularia grisea]EHA48918.1 CTR2 short splice, variant [Pyricularia oryzae 70-15]KAI6334445.1 hypothetical protein MCOR29_000749 [Pyricularia oryzae]KAI6345706.1 hypothetical protein MCOR28_003372 [Pyricularia oryzae]